MSAPAVARLQSLSGATNPQRVVLASIDKALEVEMVAQYNPGQLQIEESASWSGGNSSKENTSTLEYTGGEARTISLELFFDAFESPAGRQNVKAEFVDKLSRMLQVMDPEGPEEHKRPPLLALVWGTGLGPFTGVLTSLSTKLTMFLPDGTPVRATCSIKLTEATREALDPRPKNRVAPPPRR